MLQEMGHPATVTGMRIRLGTVTGERTRLGAITRGRIPIEAGTAAGFADRRTATRATQITTQISGMADLPGTDTHNGDRQRLTAPPPLMIMSFMRPTTYT